LANKGYSAAFKEDVGFMEGLNLFKGQVTNKAVATDLGYDFVPPEKVAN
jgi:alanine dehydrogenase